MRHVDGCMNGKDKGHKESEEGRGSFIHWFVQPRRICNILQVILVHADFDDQPKSHLMQGILSNARGIGAFVLAHVAWHHGLTQLRILLLPRSDQMLALSMLAHKPPSPYKEGEGQHGTRCESLWVTVVPIDKLLVQFVL